MMLNEVRAICEEKHEGERNRQLCDDLSLIDESFIFDIDRDILNIDSRRSPLQNLDTVLKSGSIGTDKTGREPYYNTWPFGMQTDRLFSRFLAVCRGNDTLNKVMGIIIKQSKKIAEAFRNKDTEKTVILLTDKWDNKTFVKYEKQLLRYALDEGIWYIFLLITDYGYTQIPFLPNNRHKLEEYRGAQVEDNISMNEMLDLLRMYPFEYEKYMGTWDPYKGEMWSFDVDELIWTRRSISSPEKIGAINRKDLIKLLERVRFILEEPVDSISPSIRILDSGTSVLRILGRKLSWYNSRTAQNRYIHDLEMAMKEFMEACLKLDEQQ